MVHVLQRLDLRRISIRMEECKASFVQKWKVLLSQMKVPLGFESTAPSRWTALNTLRESKK